MSLSIQYPQLCDLPPEVLSQILTLCTADWWSIRQVNRCLKLAVALKVRVIHIRPRSRSHTESVDPSKQKSPQALQRQYPVLRQVRTLGSFYFVTACQSNRCQMSSSQWLQGAVPWCRFGWLSFRWTACYWWMLALLC